MPPAFNLDGVFPPWQVSPPATENMPMVFSIIVTPLAGLFGLMIVRPFGSAQGPNVPVAECV
jgi:hypothetical protein